MSHNDYEHVATGAFGEVYRVKMPDGALIALKKPLEWGILMYNCYHDPIYATSKQLAERFCKEEVPGNRCVLFKIQRAWKGNARFLMKIVQIKEDENPEIHLEWVTGMTLYDYISKTRSTGAIPNFETRKTLLAQILYGLRILHRCGLSHRDLHVGNIIVDLDTLEPTIIDYSLVRLRDRSKKNNAEDLNPKENSSRAGFRSIALCVLGWLFPLEFSIENKGNTAVFQIKTDVKEKTLNLLKSEERKFLEKLVGKEDLEAFDGPWSFETIEDLLI